MDLGFIALLFLVAASGLALWLGRATPALALLLCLHLGAVIALFATLPYGKFAHGVFRTAALLRHNTESASPAPSAWALIERSPMTGTPAVPAFKNQPEYRHSFPTKETSHDEQTPFPARHGRGRLPGPGGTGRPDWLPNKPVTLVVGFAAGGAADAAARMIAKKLGEKHRPDRGGGQQGRRGRQYRPPVRGQGPGRRLGAAVRLHRPADDCAPHHEGGLQPFTDLAPISGGVNFPNVLVVHKGAGVKNLAEFVAKAKKSPGSGLCIDRRGLGLAPGGRAVQPARRRGDGARALQGRRRPCRTCWANASPPTLPRPRRPCRMSRPAS
jgi:hypothetical protein